jgi:hypothetical protein
METADPHQKFKTFRCSPKLFQNIAASTNARRKKNEGRMRMAAPEIDATAIISWAQQPHTLSGLIQKPAAHS